MNAAEAAEYAGIVRECREVSRRCAETGQKTISFSPFNAALVELDECDCGLAHPLGWICVSSYKDTL